VDPRRRCQPKRSGAWVLRDWVGRRPTTEEVVNAYSGQKNVLLKIGASKGEKT